MMENGSALLRLWKLYPPINSFKQDLNQQYTLHSNVSFSGDVSFGTPCPIMTFLDSETRRIEPQRLF